ncbi:UvrD-helicase domain-containing protein [Roseivirga pacifica]|uniref:UvrD-helicase domain-containing protein n=1 Tax=Roseivirga pacifica TaxID=1267423 RepID=UPI00209516D1|nr:UvrD-helicase domain-containing protein [Roseivirga pacifica]MCO6358418.1 AAA family ATPase [Roseivirga pacifica]MCO6368973.1 AAA family ATPase [Roseivirga pacifica]MCO6372323.1 AAA family ATPase [Roseivirga pacifica]MCO6374149.1 AAA family ATPase [Roseivirga pacifica]MCO6381054.1 AAA family ATPase [Roseivirga pacifica]
MALTVYKSSAGSGKTFTLVKEYIKLLIQRPEDFKHTLAITFTNKATEEMKSRILETLEAIANGTDESYLPLLLEHFDGKFEAEQIQQRANEAYELIIHNYGRFEVSTIDSFFSRVLKSFARELDLPLSYEVEMNVDLALGEAIDELFRDLDDNEQIRQWLISFTTEQIENDKSWNVDQQIEKLGKNLFQEAFQAGFEQAIELPNLKKLIDELKKDVKVYENQLKSWGNEALDLLSKHQLVLADFSGGGSRSVANTFLKLTKGDFKLTDTFLKTVAGDKSWYTQKSDKKDQIDEALSDGLLRLSQSVIDYIASKSLDYNTARAILKNIYAYGLLEALYRKLKDYRDEHNVMLISDTNIILKDILQEADAPFMFEKLGSFYKHIMIDEFQDTSNFQWVNLKPLIINALSEGHEVLIVGDVKQSIYRFRGGNMRLLLSQIKEELGLFYPKEADQNLGDNYRSLKGIVDFNNALFAQLPEALGGNDALRDTALFQQAFLKHEQNPKREAGGLVKATFYKEDWQEQAIEALLANIKSNKDKGFSLSDMLILVNRNSEISGIANAMLAEGVPFINGESLKLQQSDAVVFLLELLHYLQSDKDEVLQLNLLTLFFRLNNKPQTTAMLYGKGQRMTLQEAGFPEAFISRQHELKQLPLFDLVSELLLMFEWKAQADIYLQQLLDVVLEQSQRGVHSISAFLEWWAKEGDNQTVATSEHTNAVRILSIHKSKGLESPIVFIPFAHWNILPNATLHQFWTSELPEKYAALKYIPLDFSKNTLLESHFSEAYYKEAEESALDILNKTYVAFTRPREKLYLSAPLPKRPGASRINELLLGILPEIGFDVEEMDEQTVFAFGQDENKIGKSEETTDSQTLTVYPENSYLKKLKIRNDSDRFFMLQDTEEAQNITLGNQVHEVLSAIRVKEDLDLVLRQMQQAGELRAKTAALVKERIEKLFEDQQIASWFSDDYEVYNERELWFEGKVHKPDRLLTKGKEAIIIDYKKEKESDAHHTQVKRYMTAMLALGYDKISGFLIYVEPVVVRAVN